MLPRNLIAFLILQLALVAVNTLAAAPPKMLGFDDNSCRAWVESREDPELRGAYLAWARGFLSGHNYANQKQQVSEISRGTVEMFVERFCRDKPTAQFTDAVYRLSDQYSGRRTPITR
ncbi:MAG: hypothetical protein LBI59_11545 [Candidatus Accumulibacter sp.]|jgi:hypothetical protein|nr:hypothetical protein [Accumulibacter sp.]